MNLANYISENFAVVISCIALASVVLSPILTGLVTGICNIVLRKLEMKHETEQEENSFYRQHRVFVIERYITAAGKAARSHTLDNETEFGAAMGEIYLYVDESEWPLLKNIETSIRNGNKAAATDAISELCKVLAKKGVREPKAITSKSPKVRRFRKSRKTKPQK